MRHWHLSVLVTVLAAAGWAVIVFAPGSTTMRVVIATPVPTPAVTPQSDTVSLLFAGDTMLARSVGDVMARRGDWTWPFAAIASVTRGADLMFANLESVIASRGAQQGCGYCFRADPRAIAGLVYAGVDVVSVANNHAWDYGPDALADTLTHLASAGIAMVGAGRNASSSREPVLRTVNGTRIAYLAWTDLLPVSSRAAGAHVSVNTYEAGRFAQDIARARTLADIVIVSFHTGTEYEPQHSEHQQRIYRAAIDAGADLVVGHHPHVVQDYERHGSGWIFYSLGNFVFDQSWSPETQRGALVRVTAKNGHITDAALIPIVLSAHYQVSLVPPAASATIQP